MIINALDQAIPTVDEFITGLDDERESDDQQMAEEQETRKGVIAVPNLSKLKSY